jgi:hypothetical protein
MPDVTAPTEVGQAPRRAAIAFIFVTVVIDVLAMGVVTRVA